MQFIVSNGRPEGDLERLATGCPEDRCTLGVGLQVQRVGNDGEEEVVPQKPQPPNMALTRMAPSGANSSVTG